jgi:trans-aconitate methyltransferase
MPWDPEHYLQFVDERTRPAADLIARIDLSQPASIVDLGCRPGNSTQLLRKRWPHACVLGLDSSAEMAASARSTYPAGYWFKADIETWSPEGTFDLVFSNAVLQCSIQKSRQSLSVAFRRRSNLVMRHEPTGGCCSRSAGFSLLRTRRRCPPTNQRSELTSRSSA